MNFITGIQTTAIALNAEKVRLDVVAQNIANAHTTRDSDGNAYQRKVVTFESLLSEKAGNSGVKVGQITGDPSKGELIYSPQHPHANADGFVQMPNVNVAMEMVTCSPRPALTRRISPSHAMPDRWRRKH